ncbi:MAG: family 10 glycosylhydrolase, partial [Bacteroidales bacterium]|nr:family 10 glycosylhydrolase [Bacteroidales bacterium]
MKPLHVIILVLALFATQLLQSKEHPKREFRGAWFPTVVNTTWRDMTSQEIKRDIIFYLDLFKKLNMNAVVFQVRPQADALFVSELEPWSRFLTGNQGVAPDPFFDPTEFIIEEC